VTGPQGSIAYRTGTRNASTSLRLRDGETQILAGLINDEDRKAIQGVPGASELPVVGRLFGLHSDTRNKSEVVLLITPRVVRNLGLPDAATLSGPAGNYVNPGAASTRIRATAKVAMPIGSGSGDAPAAVPTTPVRPGAADEANAVVEVSTSGTASAGDTVSITLQNKSDASVTGQFGFDATLLQSAEGNKSDRVDFKLEPRGQRVFVLRVQAGANGKGTEVRIDSLSATSTAGVAMPVKLEGDAGLSFVAR